MALSPKQFLSNTDMEDFAKDFLGLEGIDSDLYYEAYYQLNADDEYDDDVEYRQDEISQTKWEYWLTGRLYTSLFNAWQISHPWVDCLCPVQTHSRPFN